MDTEAIVINFRDILCTRGQQKFVVYPFNIESIEKNVADGIQPANYKLDDKVNMVMKLSMLDALISGKIED